MRCFYLLILISLWSCAPQPYKASNKIYRREAKHWARTLEAQPENGPSAVNFNLRKPNYVILHHTAQNSCEHTVKTFTVQRTQTSSHYVICRNGTVHHMLNDYLRGWHSGVAKWGNDTDINSASIGIELDNNGFEPFDPVQIQSLLVLLDTLCRRYNIPAANIIGHADVAPGRKVDPSAYFPWERLAQRGFGLWYRDTATVRVPDNFNTLDALRIIGYNIADTAAAIRAFKLHYIPADSSSKALLDEGQRKILYSVSQQAR